MIIYNAYDTDCLFYYYTTQTFYSIYINPRIRIDKSFWAHFRIPAKYSCYCLKSNPTKEFDDGTFGTKGLRIRKTGFVVFP